MSTKYLAEDRSLLTPVLYRALWGPMVSRLPQGLSPNTLTLVGQLSAFLALFAAAAPGLDRTLQLAIVGAGAFGYLTLDCIDGPHARRTAQASQLGEFLDHWLDGISGGTIVAAFALVLHASWWSAAVAMTGVMLNYVATFWEQKETGTVRFSALGSTEAIVSGVVVCAVVGVLGLPQPIVDVLFIVGGAISFLGAIAGWRRGGGGSPVLEAIIAISAIFLAIGVGHLGPHEGLLPMVLVGHLAGGAMVVERITGFRRPLGVIALVTTVILVGWYIHQPTGALAGAAIWATLGIIDVRRVMATVT